MLRASPKPYRAVRKAASAYPYEQGHSSIGPFCLHRGFVGLYGVLSKNYSIKLRKTVKAIALGFLDYYDHKVTNAEGFGKCTRSISLTCWTAWNRANDRPIMEKVRLELTALYGDYVLDPWNTGYKMAGKGAALPGWALTFPFPKALNAMNDLTPLSRLAARVPRSRDCADTDCAAVFLAIAPHHCQLFLRFPPTAGLAIEQTLTAAP